VTRGCIEENVNSKKENSFDMIAIGYPVPTLLANDLVRLSAPIKDDANLQDVTGYRHSCVRGPFGKLVGLS